MLTATIVVLVAALALALAGPGLRPPLAQGGTQWSVLVGRETDDHAIQAQSYFPTVITVVAGDTVRWRLGGQHSHTVTFLGGQGRPINPVITPDGRSLLNPLLEYAQGGDTYDSARYTNSGILGGRATSYSLSFNTPGVYPYLCLLQRGMEGTVVVLPSDSTPPRSGSDYRTLGEQEWAVLRARGEALAQSAPTATEPAPGGATSYFMSAGFGASDASVLRFLPRELTIRVGDSVTWVQSDPHEVHTVTFPDQEQEAPASLTIAEQAPLGPTLNFFDPQATQPQGGPVHRGAGYYNSGIMQPFARYNLTFLQPGAYSYVCILHAPLGHVGTIVVQP